MNSKNQSSTPPMELSDEANKKQLQLAQEQGDAYQKALEHMTKKEAHGDQKRAGDYIVGYAVEHAEGMYHRHDGHLIWHNPENENVHVEITVQDGADRRFIPGLTVYVTLVDAGGKLIGTHQQPFLWHPWLFHYGLNWEVPGDGRYTIRVRIEAPDFMRHDKENGNRFLEPVEVEFTRIEIETGQKLS